MKNKLIAKLLFFLSFIFLFNIVFSLIGRQYIYPGLSALSFAVLISQLVLFFLTVSALLFYYVVPMIKEKEDTAALNRILYELLYKSVNAVNKEELYQFILDSAIETIPKAQKGCVLLLDEETNLLNFVAVKGYDFDILRTTYLSLEQTYLYREANGKIENTLIIHDPFGYDRENFRDENIKTILTADAENVMSTLTTPIIFNNKLHGMINIDSKYVDAYTQSDKKKIELFALEIVNVIKLYSSLEQVNFLSTHDQLTKLYNRNCFNEIFPLKIEEATNNKYPLSLVSIDLNYLKRTNDSYGHECGDRLLNFFSQEFVAQLPSNSYIFRYGGDEFIVLLSKMGYGSTKAFIDKIQAGFNKKELKYNDHVIPVSFCYGIVSIPDEIIDVENMLQIADERLYKMKKDFHQEE